MNLDKMEKDVSRSRRHRKALAQLSTVCDASWDEVRRLKSRRDEDLALVNQQGERGLIDISRALDDLGKGAVGGIQYRIGRSRYYAETYRKMLETMRCGNIETWWTYDQFATRSVDPVFRLIEGIGLRLEKLRDRLRTTMESVQTSAIVNQTEATRDNTYQMETIVQKLTRLSETGLKLQIAAEQAKKRASRLNLIVGTLGGFWTLIQFFQLRAEFPQWRTDLERFYQEWRPVVENMINQM
jgi:hypothetical protein